MKLPRFVKSEFKRVITFKWVSSVIKFQLQVLKDTIVRKKRKHSADAVKTCAPITHPSFHRPDPLIYSQKYLLSLGLAVTWDNPDIVLLRNGAIVSEGDLLPDTDYEIDATVWNNSFDAPVVGLTVDFAFLSFGVGTTLHSIGTKVINLGVKGSVSHPAQARIVWRTPTEGGHYCIQVELKCADDLNPSNNLGQNNVSVVSPHSAAIFRFQLKNNSEKPSIYTFPTDTFTLPILEDCKDRITTRSNEVKWKNIQALHDRNRYAIPSEWSVTISPTTVELAPNEEMSVEVSIDPPPSFTGSKAFNIHALRNNTVFAGGVTLYVSRP
jgi:hypothetical protein